MIAASEASRRVERQCHPSEERFASQEQEQEQDGQTGEQDRGQLPGPLRLPFQFGGDHRQVTCGQSAFAEQAAERVRNPKGEDEGIHDAAAGEAEKRRRGHVAKHSQDPAGEGAQGRGS
jgi:hypothetical protein